MTRQGKGISHTRDETPEQFTRLAGRHEPRGAASGILTGIVDERFRLLVKDEENANNWVRVTLSRDKARDLRDSLNLFLEAR